MTKHPLSYTVVLYGPGFRGGRDIWPDEPFADLEAALSWGRKKMADPRYTSFEVKEITRTDHGAFVSRIHMGR